MIWINKWFIHTLVKLLADEWSMMKCNHCIESWCMVQSLFGQNDRKKERKKEDNWRLIDLSATPQVKTEWARASASAIHNNNDATKWNFYFDERPRDSLNAKKERESGRKEAERRSNLLWFFRRPPRPPRPPSLSLSAVKAMIDAVAAMYHLRAKLEGPGPWRSRNSYSGGMANKEGRHTTSGRKGGFNWSFIVSVYVGSRDGFGGLFCHRSISTNSRDNLENN